MILHLDADCFFASCEMMRNPSLRDKPLVVGGQICIAKNYIAKGYGITTGMPFWEASVKCSNLQCRPVDFSLYGKVSRKMFQIADQFSDKMEVTSVDECFLDLKIHEGQIRKQVHPSGERGGEVGRSRVNNKQFYIDFANTLRTTISRQLGITVSVGIAETKTLAKIASDCNKPDGIKIVMPEDRLSFLQSVNIQDVPGIGLRQTPKMLVRGIKTPYDYIQVDLPTIRNWFHRPGVNHWWEFRGVQMLTVTQGHVVPKSIIRTRSFDSPTTNCVKVWSSYVEHTQRLLVKLQQENLVARRIWLHLRLRDFSVSTFEVKLENHTSFYPNIINAVRQLYQRHVGKNLEVRSTGVGATDLLPIENYQYSLFEGVNIRSEALESAITRINNRWGQGTIVRGGRKY